MARIYFAVVFAAALSLLRNTLASASNGMGDFLQRRDSTKTIAIPFHTLSRGYYGNVALGNELDVYLVTNITVGTPGWVVPMSINFGWGDTQLSIGFSELGDVSYTPSLSSTFDIIPDSTFNQTNGVGQWYYGNYSIDVFNINGVSFPNFTFALMDGQGFGTSSLGLGAKLDEAGISTETEPTLLSYAVENGMIQTTAYSFWFEDSSEGAPTGQVLLGGVDTGKFHGGLVTLDTTLSSNKSLAMTELTVALTSLSTSPNGNLSHQIPLASTNAPLVYPWAGPMTLPSDIVPGIWTALGATFDISVEPHLAWPIVDCSYTTNSSTFNLHFGSDLVVPINISDLTVHNGTGTDNQDGPNGAYCRLDILVASDNSTLSDTIGSAALKQMYTVFDLNLNQVSLALRNASSTVTNIVEIGPSGVPALNLNNQTATPTPSPAAASHTLTIALGVAIPVGIILIVGIVTGFFFFRRRNRRNALPGTAPDPHLSYLHSEDKPVTGPEKPELDASPGPKYTISTPGSPPVAILGAPDTLEAPSELPDNSACYSELSGVSGGTFQAYIPSR